MAWPKIIGISIGVIGLGATLFATANWLTYGFTQAHSDVSGYASVIGLVGCVSFLVLSYPTYRACDWARRTLLIVAFCVSASGVAFTIIQILAAAQQPGHSILSLLMSIGIALCFLTPPVFLIFVLRHPDVIAAFRKSPTSWLKKPQPPLPTV